MYVQIGVENHPLVEVVRVRLYGRVTDVPLTGGVPLGGRLRNTRAARYEAQGLQALHQRYRVVDTMEVVPALHLAQYIECVCGLW